MLYIQFFIQASQQVLHRLQELLHQLEFKVCNINVMGFWVWQLGLFHLSFKIKSANLLVFGSGDGHRRIFKNRPNATVST